MARALLLLMTLAACAAPPPPPPPLAEVRPMLRWDVAELRCADLIAAPEEDRAAAGLFYYGYAAAQAGTRSLDAARMEADLARALAACAAAPDHTVPQAFRTALAR